MTDPFFQYTPVSVTINGASYPTELFCQLEPDFVPPMGCKFLLYVPGKKSYYKTEKSQHAHQIPWSDGDRYLQRGNDLKLLQMQNETDARYFEYRALLNREANGDSNGNGNL